MKRILRFLVSASFFFCLLILMQIVLVCLLIIWMGARFTAVYTGLSILSLFVGLMLMELDRKPSSYQLIWLLIFGLLPVSGEVIYLLFRSPGKENRIVRRADELDAAAKQYTQDPSAFTQLFETDPGLCRQALYLAESAGSPLYGGNRCRYFSHGREFFPVFLEKLRGATECIYLEYFILDSDSSCWQEVLDILKEKAAAGVDVRVMYDGLGSLIVQPPRYFAALRACGIKACSFNPLVFSAFVTSYSFLNHRNHRKVCLVDHRLAFTGGLNLADEYMGRTFPYGEWKDTALLVEGPAAAGLCCTFLKDWGLVNREMPDFKSVRDSLPAPVGRELAQPYDDSPLDRELVGESVYLNIIQEASQYVWITTPYLIPDQPTLLALSLAAKSGIDVRIITPGIPDKRAVFLATRSYYPQLIRNGVKIYEYTPGFMHSKTYLCDNRVGVVGSINMDYRSLYLHFENGCVVYDSEALQDIHTDFVSTFARCRQIRLQDIPRDPFTRLFQFFLRLVAPLL